MKILRLDIASDGKLAISLIADSAWHPERRPVFVPDGEWRGELRIAIRIDRLGKGIAPKFARRYYSEFAIASLLLPAGVPADQSGAIIDDAMVLGAWQPIPDNGLVATDIASAPERVIDRDEVDGLISHISHIATFKTGDVILLPEPLACFAPEIGTRIRVTAADGSSLLEFPIK